MKKITIIFIVLVFVLITFASSLNSIFIEAQKSLGDYKICIMTFDLANLDYEKAKIQSTNQKTDLLANLNYYNSYSSYITSLKNFYGDIINRIFNVITEELYVSISELQNDNLKIDYNNNKTLFEKGLITKNSLIQSEIALNDSSIDLQNKRLNFENAKNDFTEASSQSYKSIKFKLYDPKILLKSIQEFLKNNYSLKIATLNLKVTQYDLDNLPYNSSEYDKKSSQIKVEKSKVTLNNLKKSLIKEYANTKNNILSTYNTLNNLKSKIILKKDEFNDAQKRYNAGLISKKELYTSKIALLNIQVSYYMTLKNYYTIIINHILDFNEKPEEVLN